MVLITDDREGGGSPVKLRQIQKSRSRSDVQVHPAQTVEYAHFSEKCDNLESCKEDGEDDFEDYDEFSELPDTRSIASDDSFYPPDDSFLDNGRTPSPESPVPLSFYQACCSNNAAIVKIMIRQGVSEDEVRETDKNRRTGLIVACYQGYVDVVIALAECPYIDVNWQDNEGNTALITAAQAGHIMISNYLLNYYSGLDIERRNCHGFTALTKAAMQGRTDCVRALMLAGADLEARDDGRRLTPRQWALFTSRYETAHLMLRLMTQPCPEQYCDSYQPEWAKLPEMLARAQEPKTCLQKLSETVRGVFSFTGGLEPAEGGVMDHFVRASTGLTSPFVTTACRTVCPGSPPCVGKRRYAVQEILHKQQSGQHQSLDPEPKGHHRKLFQNCRAALAHRKKERRSSREVAEGGGSGTQRRGSLLPSRRSSVRPDLPVPKVRVTRAPPPTYEPEKTRKKSSCRDGHLLQIPKWRYKELKEERKKAEEEERKRMEEVERRRVEAIAQRRLSAGKRK